jgi:hypothetical protein
MNRPGHLSLTQIFMSSRNVTMTSRVPLPLSEGWALSHDENQWIVLCRDGTRRPRKPGRRDTGEDHWKAVAFVGSTKVVLLRVLRENGVTVSPEAGATIAAMPERFLDWIKGEPLRAAA